MILKNFKSYCSPQSTFRKNTNICVKHSVTNNSSAEISTHCGDWDRGWVSFVWWVFAEAKVPGWGRWVEAVEYSFHGTPLYDRKTTGLFSTFHNGFHSCLLFVKLTAQMGQVHVGLFMTIWDTKEAFLSVYCTTVLKTIITAVREGARLSPELHLARCSLGNQELANPYKTSPTVTQHTRASLRQKVNSPASFSKYISLEETASMQVVRKHQKE